MHGVQVGPALSALLDGDQAVLLQFLQPGADTALGVANILGQAGLSRKALIQFTCIFEQHGVYKLRAYRDLVTLKDEVGNAGPATLRGNVCTLQAKIAIFELVGFPQALHRLDFR